MDKETDILTPAEVAKLLKCSRGTVAAMCDRGDLSWFSLGEGKRKHRRIHKSSVLDFMARGTVATIPFTDSVGGDGLSELKKFGFDGHAQT